MSDKIESVGIECVPIECSVCVLRVSIQCVCIECVDSAMLHCNVTLLERERAS